MDHKQLIERLGGPHALKREMELRGVVRSHVAVRAWALGGRNIPAKYWTVVRDIAASKDIAITFADLAKGLPDPVLEQARAA